MPMSKRAARGLEGSIKKWTKIIERLELGEDPEENGSDDCPLCQLYHPLPNGRGFGPGCCSVCPIAEKTGRDLCFGSPYEEWDGRNGETKENAQAMLNFLIELRD